MPRVLILCEYGTLNGGERSMLATLPGIAQAGFEPCIAAPPAGPLAEALCAGSIEVVPFESFDASGAKLSLEDRRRRLANILSDRRPDLLHANSLAMGRLSGPVAREIGVPSLSHLRDIVVLRRQAIADLNHHDRLLAVSEATRRFHLRQGLAANKTSVLYNGVDTELFSPAPPTGYLHDELGLPRDCPLIGTIGQISLRKGLDAVLMALSELAEDIRSSFAWLVVGQRFSEKDESRHFEKSLREVAAKVLPGHVFFLGTREDVARMMPELTLLVHAAHEEPLGRVLLEAAAASRAIVATDVGGTPEIFPPQSDSAVLVPPADPPAMARAIGGLLGNPARRLQLGGNARSRVENEFTVERAVTGLLTHYESFACSSPGRAACRWTR